MLDWVEFLVGEALVSLRRNTWMTFAAVTTSAMALFLLGGLAYVYASMAGFVRHLGSQVEMKVFVKDSVSDKDAKALADVLLDLPGVSSVRFVDRDRGLKEFLSQNPDIDVRGLVEDNPLPNAYIVTVKDLSQFELVAARVARLEQVEPGGVKYPAVEQDFLKDVMSTVFWLGLSLGALMLVTSGILIYNAIRLTVLARQREIRIMQLVGATRFTVRVPMLLEGIVQGATGGLLAAIVLWCSHGIVGATVVRGLSAFGRLQAFPLSSAVLTLAVVGAGYGLVCSWIALTEPLRFRRRVV